MENRLARASKNSPKTPLRSFIKFVPARERYKQSEHVQMSVREPPRDLASASGYRRSYTNDLIRRSDALSGRAKSPDKNLPMHFDLELRAAGRIEEPILSRRLSRSSQKFRSEKTRGKFDAPVWKRWREKNRKRRSVGVIFYTDY